MASVFGGDSASPRTPPQPLEALQQQPPRRRRPQTAHRGLRINAPPKVGPARRDRPRAAIHQPTNDRRLTGLGAPPQHLQLNTAKLTGRVNEPHPLRQRVHNMSSATPTRRAPARPTSRSRCRSARASPVSAHCSRPRRSGSHGSPTPSARATSRPNCVGCRSSRCSSSTRSATSRSIPRPRT